MDNRVVIAGRRGVQGGWMVMEKYNKDYIFKTFFLLLAIVTWLLHFADPSLNDLQEPLNDCSPFLSQLGPNDPPWNTQSAKS